MLGLDVAAGLADDDGKLAFEVEIVGYRRPHHLAVVADQRVGEADEHARLLRQFAAGLGGVGAVIDAGAENFFRLRNHRQEFHVGELAVWLGVSRSLAHGVHGAGGKRGAQARVADAIVQSDDAVAAHRTEKLLAVGDKTQNFHCALPLRTAAGCAAAPVVRWDGSVMSGQVAARCHHVRD